MVSVFEKPQCGHVIVDKSVRLGIIASAQGFELPAPARAIRGRDGLQEVRAGITQHTDCRIQEQTGDCDPDGEIRPEAASERRESCSHE